MLMDLLAQSFRKTRLRVVQWDGHEWRYSLNGLEYRRNGNIEWYRSTLPADMSAPAFLRMLADLKENPTEPVLMVARPRVAVFDGAEYRYVRDYELEYRAVGGPWRRHDAAVRFCGASFLRFVADLKDNPTELVEAE